eukprot:15476471-Alexandrium_andersonii.AAC.1
MLEPASHQGDTNTAEHRPVARARHMDSPSGSKSGALAGAAMAGCRQTTAWLTRPDGQECQQAGLTRLA